MISTSSPRNITVAVDPDSSSFLVSSSLEKEHQPTNLNLNIKKVLKLNSTGSQIVN